MSVEGSNLTRPQWQLTGQPGFTRPHGVTGTNVESRSPGAASTRKASRNINMTTIVTITPPANHAIERIRIVTDIGHVQGVGAPTRIPNVLNGKCSTAKLALLRMGLS